MTQENEFPSIEDSEIKAAMNKQLHKTQQPPKIICEKHGELNDAYAFRVNMPEFGYENKHYCLVCACEYLSMIANEVTFEERGE